MCIDCHKEAMRHVIAMLELGKSVRVEPAARFDEEPELQQRHMTELGLVGGDIARVLDLTMVNGSEPETGEPSFSIDDKNVEAISDWFALLSPDRLQSLRITLNSLRVAAEVARDVTLDAMKRRAAEAIESGRVGEALELADHLGLLHVQKIGHDLTLIAMAGPPKPPKARPDHRLN